MTLSSRERLAKQVRWRSDEIARGRIDQTELAIADAPEGAVPFSFLVMGDTDAGLGGGLLPQSFATGFAQQMLGQLGESRFLLHTGDVTYPTGSYENYLLGFLQPYRALLKKLPSRPDGIREKIVFNRPLLPVPGNHDYARVSSVAGGLLRFLCDRLRQVGIDWGHYGGEGGEAYGQAFLDELDGLTLEQRGAHLAAHYDAESSLSSDAFGCLNYQPGRFTRLPNRYYRFRYGGVDFFALDSNTWNMDSACQEFDSEQLDWLVRSLVASGRSLKTVGRIIYLHHSPYTTETTRWQQPETIWVRRHLRTVLDRAAAKLSSTGSSAQDSVRNRPIVDLILSGHAHCLEHLKTTETNHADTDIDWIVCGGSGVDVRRQRRAGADILEQLSQAGRSYTGVVAKSLFYQGVQGQDRRRSQSHSFLRIDVDPAAARPFSAVPFVVRRQLAEWQLSVAEPLAVGGVKSRV